jgi:threonine dehydrogenase-like Zn-dependent dehydrogenase
MPTVAFTAPEYQPDGTIRPAAYELSGSEDGWEIAREGATHVRLGPGYRLLRSSHCGVCATDLARRHLPFRLPQVIGHEIVAVDEQGTPVAVEINASHAARGLASHGCAYCESGLSSHCPGRLVVGIHDLPGGFGPWLLAPARAVVAVPATISPHTATFVEPFAAALHAVRVVTRVPRRRIAVLGPRRLGSLVVAALAAWRRQHGGRYEVLALARRPELRALALALGADVARDPAGLEGRVADVVVDTTGSPAGFRRAVQLAEAEVHVKTTCGTPAGGLAHATAMVVDEIALARDDVTPLAPPAGGPAYRTALVLDGTTTAVRDALTARGLQVLERAELGRTPFGAADVVVARSLAEVDQVIRPVAGVERGLVRPRGLVLLVIDAPLQTLDTAVAERGLVVSTSRCGDFRAALDLLPETPDLAAHLVTATFPATRLGDAFAAAASPAHLKVVVTHPAAVL